MPGLRVQPCSVTFAWALGTRHAPIETRDSDKCDEIWRQCNQSVTIMRQDLSGNSIFKPISSNKLKADLWHIYIFPKSPCYIFKYSRLHIFFSESDPRCLSFRRTGSSSARVSRSNPCAPSSEKRLTWRKHGRAGDDSGTEDTFVAAFEVLQISRLHEMVRIVIHDQSLPFNSSPLYPKSGN